MRETPCIDPWTSAPWADWMIITVCCSPVRASTISVEITRLPSGNAITWFSALESVEYWMFYVERTCLVIDMISLTSVAASNIPLHEKEIINLLLNAEIDRNYHAVYQLPCNWQWTLQYNRPVEATTTCPSSWPSPCGSCWQDADRRLTLQSFLWMTNCSMSLKVIWHDPQINVSIAINRLGLAFT